MSIEKQVVAARDGDLDRAADAVLALDLGKIDPMRGVGRLAEAAFLRVERRHGQVAVEEAHGLVQGVDRDDFDVLDEGRLLGGFAGEDNAALAGGAGEHREGQPAADRPHIAGQAQLTGDDVLVEHARELLVADLARGHEHAEGDGQVVERAFLADVAGGEVDRGPRFRIAEAGVAQRRVNTVDGLLDG